MSKFPDAIQNILGAATGTATTTPAKIPANQAYGRKMVLIYNGGAVAIYGKVLAQTQTGPTITAADAHFSVAPGSTMMVPAGSGIGVWVATAASTAAYGYAELDSGANWDALRDSPGGAASSVTIASEHAEDSASASGDMGVAILGVRIDTPAAQAALNDYVWPIFDALSRLWTHAQSEGLDAHDAAATANPLMNGGIAQIAFPTAVAAADAVRAMHDKFGRQVATIGAPSGLKGNAGGIATASTSDISVVSTPGAGFRRVITSVRISNSDTTAGGTQVTLKTGTTAIGQPYQAPASGGNNFSCEIFCADNEAFQFACAASRTSVTVNVDYRTEPV